MKPFPLLSHVPGGGRRLLRERLRALSFLVCALVVLLASALHAHAQTVLAGALRDRARGTYDILVTAADPDTAGRTLRPSVLGAAPSAARLTLEQVEQVRRLPGVDVAAPVGTVLLPSAGTTTKGVLTVPFADGASPPERAPQAVRVAVTVTTATVRGGTSATTATRDYVLDRGAWSGTPAEYDAKGNARVRALASDGELGVSRSVDLARDLQASYGAARTEPGVFAGPEEGVVQMVLPLAAVGNSSLVLVDPVAEADLLGTAGRFLEPLARDDALIGAAYPSWDPTIAHPPGEDLSTLVSSAVVARPLPVLLPADLPGAAASSTHVRIQVQPLDVPTSAAAALLDRARGGELQAAAVDLRALTSTAHPGPIQTVYDSGVGGELSPADNRTLNASWPGPDPTVGEPWYWGLPTYDPLGRLSGAARRTPIHVQSQAPATITADARGRTDRAQLRVLGYSGGAERQQPAQGPAGLPPGLDQSLQVTPGLSDLNAPAPVPSDGRAPGDEADLSAAEPPLLSPITRGDRFDSTPYPVGTFSITDLAGLTDGPAGLPLGYAEPEDATAPTFTGRGAPPVSAARDAATAIASLTNASRWGLSAPVDAIRVRVAGPTGYSEQTRAAIAEVAQRLQAIGLHATVVAGASRRPVQVITPEAPQGQGAGEQVLVASTVRSRWPLLGAAADVATGLSQTARAVLVLAVAVSCLLLIAVALASIPARREHGLMLVRLGWRCRDVLWWEARQEAWGVGAVAAAAISAAIAWPPAGTRTGFVPLLLVPLTAAVVTAVVVLTVLAVGAGSAAGSGGRAGSGHPRRASRPAAPGHRLLLPRHRPRRSLLGRGPLPVMSRPWRLGLRWFAASPLSSASAVLASALTCCVVGLGVRSVQEGLQAMGSTELGNAAAAAGALTQESMALLSVIASVLLLTSVRRSAVERRRGELRVLLHSGWGPRDVAMSNAVETAATVIPATLLAVSVVAAQTGNALWATVSTAACGMVIALVLLLAAVQPRAGNG